MKYLLALGPTIILLLLVSYSILRRKWNPTYLFLLYFPIFSIIRFYLSLNASWFWALALIFYSIVEWFLVLILWLIIVYFITPEINKVPLSLIKKISINTWDIISQNFISQIDNIYNREREKFLYARYQRANNFIWTIFGLILWLFLVFTSTDFFMDEILGAQDGPMIFFAILIISILAYMLIVILRGWEIIYGYLTLKWVNFRRLLSWLLNVTVDFDTPISNSSIFQYKVSHFQLIMERIFEENYLDNNSELRSKLFLNSLISYYEYLLSKNSIYTQSSTNELIHLSDFQVRYKQLKEKAMIQSS